MGWFGGGKSGGGKSGGGKTGGGKGSTSRGQPVAGTGQKGQQNVNKSSGSTSKVNSHIRKPK